MIPTSENFTGQALSGRHFLPARLRTAVGLIFMLDILRRLIGGETRPVDLWIIVIELLVLAIILMDSIWDKAHKFSEWKNTRREFQHPVISVDGRNATWKIANLKCRYSGSGMTQFPKKKK